VRGHGREGLADAGDRSPSVLAVCTGNICRSPFIELALQDSLEAVRPVDSPGIRVSSAGTNALVGAPMDVRAAAQARALELDPSPFVARSLTANLVAEADLVLAATRAHSAAVVSMYPGALGYTFTFIDFATLVTTVGIPLLLDDPGLSQSRPRVQQVVSTLAARRGAVPPLPSEQADIVDPYRRADEYFVRMAEQIQNSLPAVVAGLAA
jgi:low molecular weight protein-tyrosine phosphatase